MDIGSKIAEARQKRGLTQKQVAEALWISVQAVSLWEKSKSTPKGERLFKLSQILGVSPNYLLGKDEKIEAEQFSSSSDEIAVLPISKLVILLISDESVLKEHTIGKVKPTKSAMGKAFAFQLNEQTRGNGFRTGDILIFDTGIVPHAGDLCIIGVSSVDKSQKVEKTGKDTFSVPMSMRITIRQLATDESVLGNPPDDGTESREMSDKKRPLILGVMVEHRSFRSPVPPPEDDSDITIKL